MGKRGGKRVLQNQMKKNDSSAAIKTSTATAVATKTKKRHHTHTHTYIQRNTHIHTTCCPYQRVMQSSIALVSAWPKCKVPVTFGGGITMTNFFGLVVVLSPVLDIPYTHNWGLTHTTHTLASTLTCTTNQEKHQGCGTTTHHLECMRVVPSTQIEMWPRTNMHGVPL